ncbi:alpha-ketoglutarate-dependent dioxygenase AlkB family protein [Marinomonas balearica]|uniref:Alkylated DNA repair dioxygenase AlkB n=1 Tax=Marinomonas balearica TaxID=491947 RepID=A0A4R6MAY1_9GAMM|nr:alpha-ketoglutarate-dependent dioxygenase AlkB [Marinomonas balearica]TDO98721.1 alkylated DNA repair dioxygenase AlkB [Marinomonas balearica]
MYDAPYRYIPPSSSNGDNFQLLRQKIDWQQESLTMFGKDILVPRLVSFIADAGLQYTYSGKTHSGYGWPDWMKVFKLQAELLTGQTYNSVLANLYRHGEDYMGWHSDNERELGPAPVVVTYSVGATRDFLFRLKRDHKTKTSIKLENESWLIMSASAQVLWQHSLPVRKKVTEERISLTFRQILREGSH